MPRSAGIWNSKKTWQNRQDGRGAVVKNLGFGLIGTGFMGKAHAIALRSVATVFPEVEAPTGVLWDLEIPCCIGHSGNDFGTTTFMYFNKESGVGRILFTNISLETEELEEAGYGLFNTLFEYDLLR